jgi:hypothetical protein
MNWNQKVGIDGAELMLVTLSGIFAVRRPRLKKGRKGYRSKGNSGHYYPLTHSITLGPECEAWVVAHEFAHYLYHLTRIPPKPRRADLDYAFKAYQWRRRNLGHGIGEWHGQAFYHCLRHVLEALGEAELYPWNREYRTIKAMAAKDFSTISTG